MHESRQKNVTVTHVFITRFYNYQNFATLLVLIFVPSLFPHKHTLISFVGFLKAGLRRHIILSGLQF